MSIWLIVGWSGARFVVKLIEFHLGANPSYFRLLYLLDCLMLTGLDRTYHAYYFIFSFIF